MRKKLIEEVGGLRSFGCYLAEDFFLAKSFMDRGWKLRISHQPAWQNPGSCEITAFQARITRYASAMILNAANSDDDFSHFFFQFQLGKTTYRHGTRHDPSGTYFRMHVAGSVGGMGRQLALRLGSTSPLLGPRATLVPLGLAPAVHRPSNYRYPSIFIP